MAHITETNFCNPSVTKVKRLAKIKHTALKLLEEEKAIKGDCTETEKMKKLNLQCAKCRGESDKSEMAHIEDLCPVERNRIKNLIHRLTECTREKHKAEEQLAILKAEKEALENQYKLFRDEGEHEKSQLKLQVQDAVTNEKKLRLQTLQSLDLLMRQIQNQEKQFSRLTVATRSLVKEKSQLEKSLSEMEAKLRDAETDIEKVKEKAEIEKLVLLKEYIQKLIVKREDRSCQTDQDSDFDKDTSLDAYSEKKDFLHLEVGRKISMEKLINGQRTKSKDDLEEHTVDNKMLQDLFFKGPNFDDNECLDIPLTSLVSHS